MSTTPALSTPSPPAVLTVREVAAELRCSKAHVHNIIAGKVHGLPPLPVLRIGRRVLVRHEALAHWLDRIEGRELEIMRGSGDFLPDEDLESIAGA
ncbi:MAG TPA: helix-turn-helix domain-containing protein [Bryobacteraceae bacterium]|nr:helix-turn-helix domain-containing protein [Bryobacteraceae bacterium]